MITEHAVRLAFETILAGFTAGGDVTTESMPPYTPIGGQPYLSGRLSAYSAVPLGVGPDAPQSVSGSYQINVQRPAVEGVGPGGGIAGLLTALFPRGEPLALGTGPVLTVEQSSEQPAIYAGDWLTVPVVVRFFGTD